jgi:hypothetical protein
VVSVCEFLFRFPGAARRDQRCGIAGRVSLSAYHRVRKRSTRFCKN